MKPPAPFTNSLEESETALWHRTCHPTSGEWILVDCYDYGNVGGFEIERWCYESDRIERGPGELSDEEWKQIEEGFLRL